MLPLFKNYLFWLHLAFVVARGMFSCGMHVSSSFPTRDQIWAAGALGAWSLTNLTTREVPLYYLLTSKICMFYPWVASLIAYSMHYTLHLC